MRKTLFLFTVFFLLSFAGCSSNAENKLQQRQNNNITLAGRDGKLQQNGAATREDNPGTVEAEPGELADVKEDYPGEAYGSRVGLKQNTGDTGTTGGAAITENKSGITGVPIFTNPSGDELVGEITLKNIKTPVRLGETGSLTIQGQPHTQYTITAVYDNTRDTIMATAVKQADSDGTVNWTWDVNSDTKPGTYGLMITGGGRMLTASYTVAE